MAYLAFNDIDGGPAAPRGWGPVAVAPHDTAAPDLLTTLEWSVVGIARNDSRRSLNLPKRKSALTRFLFSESNPRLADPRLEALRRLAVLVWHDGPAVPPDECDTFLSAGFTGEQLHAVSTYIVAARERDRGTVALL